MKFKVVNVGTSAEQTMIAVCLPGVGIISDNSICAVAPVWHELCMKLLLNCS